MASGFSQAPKGDGKGKGGYAPGPGAAPMDEDDDEDYDESSEEEDSDGHDGCGCKNEDDEEKHHFLDVCYSFMRYQKDAMYDLGNIQEAISTLDAHDLALWEGDPTQWVNKMGICVQLNAKFLAQLPSPDVSGVDLGPDAGQVVRTPPPGHHVASRNASKVRSTLRQFVRDWAEEGAAERAASYDPLMQALRQRMPATDKKGNYLGNGQGANGAPRVLCPGCGLGRLPFELAKEGYDAQGNEFSYHMLLGAHLMLNRCTQEKSHTIFPYVLSTGHRRVKADHLRPVKIPEVAPAKMLPRNAALSMTAGEFGEVYKNQANEWDALLTPFFIDTSKNIILCIRHFAELIRPGGLWINLGPLLYHYAEQENEISIELSWEEVKSAMSKYFTIEEENLQLASYTTIPGSMYAVKYRCVFFVAIRNSEPISGESAPVFPTASKKDEMAD